MRIWIVLSSFLILYFVYGFYISQYEVGIIKSQLKKDSTGDFYEYKGVINVHTDLSLGSSPPSTVIAVARQVGLDFIMITDLNVFDLPDNMEGYNGSTLVMVGGKYSYIDSRLIDYSLSKNDIGFSLGDAQTSLADYLSQPIGSLKDNLLILAHPFKSGFTWSGDIPSGLDGIEILNMKTQSQRAWEESKLSVFWSLLTYPFNPKLAFLRLFFEPSEELALFDQLSTQRKITAFAGSEASARAIPVGSVPIRFPSYSRIFEFVTNHVLLKSELTGNFQADRVKILQALKQGQFYIGFDLLGDPKGFSAVLNDANKIHPIGSTVKFKAGQKLQISLSSEPNAFFEVVVYKNGFRHATFNTVESTLNIAEPGAYRVQVRVSPFLPLPDAKRWFTWIYTNPFFIRD